MSRQDHCRAVVRKRGNTHWARHMPPGRAVLATDFENQVRQLRLTPEFYVYSAELRTWCEHNRNRCYVSEWLLEEWGVPVDLNFSAA
jgi:hypothetical protein